MNLSLNIWTKLRGGGRGGASITGFGSFTGRALGVGGRTGSSLRVKKSNKGLGDEAVVGAGLVLRKGVLREISTKRELVIADRWVIKEEVPSRRRIGDADRLLR
ncbi:19782_t:CDS:2 [Gigaspora margarita]|uniref:19782_t:CDS:1 n=1 Tax=Gigaspora margarita TaxID=4874 RepID=A0ABM8W536_GIGMA|nr:19782_t:CDS:2 [Gigaspora margarita]